MKLTGTFVYQASERRMGVKDPSKVYLEVSRNDVPADGLPEVDEPPASEEEILLPEISPTPTPEIPYDELLTSLTTLSEDVAAMREVMEKNQEYYETYQNMGNVLIYGAGLLFGVICVLIFANYIRH